MFFMTSNGIWLGLVLVLCSKREDARIGKAAADRSCKRAQCRLQPPRVRTEPVCKRQPAACQVGRGGGLIGTRAQEGARKTLSAESRQEGPRHTGSMAMSTTRSRQRRGRRADTLTPTE